MHTVTKSSTKPDSFHKTGLQFYIFSKNLKATCAIVNLHKWSSTCVCMLTYSDAGEVNGTLLQIAKWRCIGIIFRCRDLLHVVGGKPQLHVTTVISSPPSTTATKPLHHLQVSRLSELYSRDEHGAGKMRADLAHSVMETAQHQQCTALCNANPIYDVTVFTYRR